MKKVSFFDSLETRLEKYIEGLFKEKYCGAIQPVDISKKLLREMKNGKRVSIDSVLVPNNYVIYLNNKDFEHFEPYINLLVTEMKEYLLKKARERNYTLVGNPIIDFKAEDEMEIGNIQVHGGYTETEKIMIPEIKDVYDDLKKNRNRFLKNLKSINLKEKQYYLVIEEEAISSKLIELKGKSLCIGRDQSCDITFSDKSISRHHAVLEQHRNSYVIRDLGSTNGTFVNGKRITKKMLKSGDQIRLGNTLCFIKVEKQ